MANMTLKVTPEEVRAKAGAIEAQKNLMDGLMAEMGQKVTGLSESWQSRSGEDYVAKYQGVTKNITASLEALMNHIKNLTEAAAKYDEIETEQFQKTQSLSANNIF